jgi:hypothetical protein
VIPAAKRFLAVAQLNPCVALSKRGEDKQIRVNIGVPGLYFVCTQGNKVIEERKLHIRIWCVRGVKV